MTPYGRLIKDGGERTIGRMLAILARDHPQQEAVVGPEGRLDYRELYARVTDVAARLRGRGLAPGDRVGIYCANGLRWLVGTLAVQTAGLIAVPINTWSRRDELVDLVTRGGIALVLHGDRVFGRDPAQELREAGLAGEALVSWPATAALPPLDAAPPPTTSTGPAGSPRTRGGDIALMVPTSGSTSRPKLVQLRHDGLLDNGFAIGQRLGMTPGDRVWFGGPLFFSYGCANVVPVTLTHAATLCLQERIVGDEALEMIERERCTIYYGFGPTTRLLLEADAFGRHDISSLRTGTTGFTAQEKAWAIDGLGIAHVSSVYGMTEAYGHSTMTTPGDPRSVVLGTQGRVLRTQEIRVVDGDGRPCERGQTGEIQLRGCVTPGYYADPEANASTFTEDRWLRTGDIGLIDDRDRLVFVERAKDLLKVNGINVSPAEIERLLAEHPTVGQAYVVGGVDDAGAPIVIGFVVPRLDHARAAPIEPAALREFVRANAASYKVPAQIHVIAADDLPLTATGKVNKRLLVPTLKDRHEP